MSTAIESRTIDGRIFVAADDLAAALRARADEYAAEVASFGDHPDYEDVGLGYRATAEELRQRADALDCAAIAHVSEN